jgi:hypothetical protein
MRTERLAGTAVAVALVLSGAARAEAEVRTEGLSGRGLKTWKSIVAVVEAKGPDGQLLHPRLHQLYRELAANGHAVRILIPDAKGSSAIAGRFRIEGLGADGRHEASITLNLRTIDRVLTGSPDAQLVSFERLSRMERYAQVLGHEMAHAAWTLGDTENTRLVMDVQRRSLELAYRARTEGVAGEGFSQAVQENERLVRLLEEPALVAEAAITEELRGQ